MKALLATAALFCLTGCTVITTPVQVDWGVTATVSVGTMQPAYPGYGYYPPPYAYPVPVRQDRHGHWKTLRTPGMDYRPRQQPPRYQSPRQRPPQNRPRPVK